MTQSSFFVECPASIANSEVIGVMLNLDPKSPAAYSMSLFREGVRIADPQQIPEGRALRAVKQFVEASEIKLCFRISAFAT